MSASAITMVMPMAGRGSRFRKQGVMLPKPLVDLQGKPFFWWASEAVRRSTSARVDLVYVILEEHARDHGLDATIRELYPAARIVAIPEVTAGALDTACVALPHVDPDAPLMVNDCDHFFRGDFDAHVALLRSGDLDGFLCHFDATSPAYSYADYDPDGRLIRTVEKQPISRHAIAGCYAFRTASLLAEFADIYRRECPYDEIFVSGVFNVLARHGRTIRGLALDRHVSFGTPEEYAIAKDQILPAAEGVG
jgi:dTDP-glucose pyrophosphorylase